MRTLFIVTLITFIGCGVRNVEVSGKATCEDGSPLRDGAAVCFVDIGSEYSVSGTVQADGTYKLVDNATHKTGIKPGEYKVVLGNTRVMVKSGNTFIFKDTVAPAYADKSTTPLTVTVKPGPPMTYDVNVPPFK